MKANPTILTLSVIVSLFFVSFTTKNDEGAYQTEINQWHKKRIECLKSEERWLNLAGLFWLKEGENTSGSDEKTTSFFPKKHQNTWEFWCFKTGQ